MSLPKGYGGNRSQNTPSDFPNEEFPTFKTYRIRPLIVFVVIPIILIIISSYLPIESPKLPNIDISISNFSDIWRIIVDYYNYSITSLSKIGYWISLAIYAIMYLIVFSTYREAINYIYHKFIMSLANREPFIDSNFFAFEKPEDAIIELRYIEKISYIVIPIMIFLNLIYYISLFSPNIWTDNLMQFFGNISIERIYILSMILNALSFTLFPFFVVILSGSFRFYLARTFILIAQTKTNKIDKMKYYMHGFKTYNKYLARILNIKLDELKIYSSLLSGKKIDEKNLFLSFDEKNKLKPIGWLTDITNKTDLILQVTRLQMVKDSVEFALVILPPAFTLLALAFPSLAPTLKSLAGQ